MEEDLQLDRCQEALGDAFSDPGLLVRALTHASAKGPEHPSYERLEFLGDSVLGLIISRLLFDRHPEFEEGNLTRIKSVHPETN